MTKDLQKCTLSIHLVMENSVFKSPSGKQHSPEDLIREIIAFMQADKKKTYKIIIGTDSECCADKKVDFVTAIVVHRVGNGGRYFWRRCALDKIPTLRDRIWQEVLISLDAAKDFMNTIKHFEMPTFDFEIHVDIGEKGKTSALIQELVGVIRANDFTCRIKPESFAASSVADRHNQHSYSKP